MNNVVMLVAIPFIIYEILAILMGALPGWVLSQTPPAPGLIALSAQQARGRDTYVAEGCAYCHTQQVRPLKQDLVFGRPSIAGDYAYATPELLGSERNGPDLSNIGSRQPSDAWQYIHLYQPRSLVSASIMPAFPWFFQTKKRVARGDIVVSVPPGYAPAGYVIIASPEAQDLVAYLKSLKQVPLVPAGRR